MSIQELFVSIGIERIGADTLNILNILKQNKMKNRQNDKYFNEESRKREIDNIRKSPLPKRGFGEFIEHDKTYRNAIQELLEHTAIKLDVLSKKCEAVPKTREAIAKNIDMLCEFHKTKIELFDLKAKLFSIANLITDKENHFNYVFLPQYEKEIKESNEKLKDTLAQVRDIVSKKDHNDLHTPVLRKMETELEAYDGLDKKERQDEERQLHLYKPLKRLLAAYNKTQNEIEEIEKYK